MTTSSLTVLLATFNGAKYLPEQLESLRQQSFTDFKILVRDDGSTDGTLAILNDARQFWGNRLCILHDRQPRLGPSQSFARLLHSADTPYVSFCDQDDYWLPTKLQAGMDRIRDLEGISRTVPSMVCSDVVVTDARLQPVSPSYFAKHNFSVSDGRDLQLGRLVFRNYAIGATTMINRALIRACGGIPPEAVMHDWWLALLATCLGKVAVLDEPLMLYRQHGANAVGSRRRPVPRNASELRCYAQQARKSVLDCARQAESLLRVYEHELTATARHTLSPFMDFSTKKWQQRFFAVTQTRAYKPGAMLNALHLYACATASSSAENKST